MVLNSKLQCAMERTVSGGKSGRLWYLSLGKAVPLTVMTRFPTLQGGKATPITLIFLWYGQCIALIMGVGVSGSNIKVGSAAWILRLFVGYQSTGTADKPSVKSPLHGRTVSRTPCPTLLDLQTSESPDLSASGQPDDRLVGKSSVLSHGGSGWRNAAIMLLAWVQSGSDMARSTSLILSKSQPSIGEPSRFLTRQSLHSATSRRKRRVTRWVDKKRPKVANRGRSDAGVPQNSRLLMIGTQSSFSFKG